MVRARLDYTNFDFVHAHLFISLRSHKQTNNTKFKSAGLAPFFLLPSSFGSSRSFLCEGPDRVVRMFWWRRLPEGDYDVSLVCLLLAAYL
jgi:hypothetical protein